MAEGKVLVKENKEVGFSDLELRISKPSLASDKTLQITGNFTELSSRIRSVVDRYKTVQLTEDNVSYVKTLKQQFVSLRTGIERERREYKKAYITPASKLLDSMCDELQKIVNEGESALQVQLEEYDERRKNELTLVLKEYVSESARKHNLRAEYEAQIQLLDKYYNKTQAEEDSADDIERQAVELEKKQNEYDSGVELISAECEEAGFLADVYIRQLAYKSAVEIIKEIKADKKAKAEKDIAQTSADDTEEKIQVGEPISEELRKAMTYEKKEALRTRIMRVTYKATLGKEIARFFVTHGIEYEFIKADI